MKKVFWIAHREFVAMVFARAFLIGLLFPPVLVGVVAVVMSLIDDDGFRVSGRIAIFDPTGRVTAEARQVMGTISTTGESADALREAGESLAEVANLVESIDTGPDFTLMQLPADADIEAEKLFLLEPQEAGGLLALVRIHADALAADSESGEFGSYDIYTAADIDEREISAVRAMLRDSIVNLRIEAYGFERDLIERMTQVARGQSITVTETEERASVGGLNVIVPGAFILLIMIGVMSGGQALMTSTIEEKSSRVIEVLLSAVSPMQLMAGKLLGYMGVSLLGMSIYLTAGLFVLASISMLDLIELSLIGYLFVFFLIAFFMIATLMMAVGAAVNELREAQMLMMPVTVIIILPMALWMPISRDPNSAFSISASFIPPLNSFAMLLRLASTEPPPIWQAWLSVGIGVVAVLGAVWLASRIFRIGILLAGKPPNWLTLLKWVRAG